jgi:hypothetical protein
MLKLEQGKADYALNRYRSRQFVGQSLQVLLQPVVSSSVSAVVVSPVGARASRTEPQGPLISLTGSRGGHPLCCCQFLCMKR